MFSMYESDGGNMPYFDQEPAAPSEDTYRFSADVPDADLLPTEVADGVAESTDTTDETAIAEARLAAADEWVRGHIGQVHFIGGEPHRGEHPNPRIVEKVEDYYKVLAQEKAELERNIAELPNRNEEFAADIALAHDILAGRYGEQMRGIPITVLSGDNYELVAGHDTRAMHVLGRMLIKASDEDLAKYGPDFVLAGSLHEGAHAAGETEHIVYTRCDPAADGSPEALEEQFQNMSPVSNRKVGGLRSKHLTDVVTNISEANPWEEAVVELFAVKEMTRLGRVVALKGNTGDRMADGVPVNYAGKYYDGPNIDPATSSVFIPFNFSSGAHLENGKLTVSAGASEMFAYGLHLLEQRFPGLHDQLIAGQKDPAVREAAAERLDTLQRGMYSYINAHPYTEHGAYMALTHIINTLGIAGQPMQHGTLPTDAQPAP